MFAFANFSGKRFIDKAFLFYVRNVPEHPAKLRVVYFINDRFFKKGVHVVSENKSELKVSAREFLGNIVISLRCYEPTTINLCADILKNGGTFIDIGANIGLFTITLSRIPNVFTYAIEPSPGNFVKLMDHIIINQLTNVTAVNLALAANESFGYLTLPDSTNFGNILADENKDGINHLVRLVTLKDLVKYLDIKKIDLIKMDVEGFEMNVLTGYFDQDTTIIPENIIMEFSPMLNRTGYSELECYNYLIALGYQSRNLDGRAFVFGDELLEGNLWFSKVGQDAGKLS